MEWMTDPTAWMGLGTLVLLELILGIDNLVFIAILVQKLPPQQRDKARKLGLFLALGMRIVFLVCISWLSSLTEPLIHVADKGFSGRDLILLIGGLFLLFKATSEIHGRLEGKGHGHTQNQYRAKFWMVITQIIVLDAVFSLDAVITAVGMVDHVSVMIIAVTLAVGLMVIVSKPLTEFVNAHPTIVMLCLGFLLMVGFSLMAEGYGFHIPKGYLYAAIGFSILIEAFNQFAQERLRRRTANAPDLREKTADTILKALGARRIGDGQTSHEIGALLHLASKQELLSPAEKELLRGVLNLTTRPVSTIMTPRTDIEWLDLDDPEEAIRKKIADTSHSQLLVGHGSLDNVIGVVDKDDFLKPLIDSNKIPPLAKIAREPLYIHENMTVLNLLEMFKKNPTAIAVVVDEFGSLEGLVTHHDLLEVMAGGFPDHDDPKSEDDIVAQADGSFLIDGMASIYDVRDRTGFDYEPDGTFATLSGFLLHEFSRIPQAGESYEWNGWVIEVLELTGKRAGKLRLAASADAISEAGKKLV
jgi:CBS domain containing-hemolysin-like protein